MNLKKPLLIVTAILAVILSCFLCTASAENLLTNADFVHIGSEGLPSGWDTDAYILEPGYSVFSLSEGDHDHPIAVSIQNIGKNDARFEQTVEVEPDTIYCLSGYILAEEVQGGHGANLSVEGVYAFSEKCYDTNGEWKYIEYYGETGPEQHSLTVFARLGGYSGESTGKAFFANLSLAKAEGVPGDGIADLWYRADYSYNDNDEYDDEEKDEDEPENQRAVLLVFPVLYAAFSLIVLYREHKRRKERKASRKISPVYTGALLLMAFILRIVISWFVEGYMVDVNCFLSWGRTMAAVGPSGFYEATSFCDYPPLYTYVLAFDTAISGIFPGSAGFQRIAFRLIPSICLYMKKSLISVPVFCSWQYLLSILRLS